MEKPQKKISVLIVAGGSGQRMGADRPKQFLSLAGKPVIVHSIEKFRNTIPGADIYVALAGGMASLWREAANIYGLTDCTVCKGGPTRFHTVANCLSVIEPCDLVLVHDAVRPLVSEEVIASVIDSASLHGAAIPVVVPVDSFRVIEQGGTSTPFDRHRLRAVQTPQGFAYSILSKAYRIPYRDSFTDDAQVVETAGYPVAMCEGSPLNIKLTYPEDMVTAEAILGGRKK
ncbi:MAG: 2-C-methyl-D-erythritol 4-phosphate cytidylyltransferase [Rikenellaceae bacterium]|nr:2-C-methyl-D-erythritol 4-phosphate cytidylyltransferase [Rikenellaceae bacterium]